jgi:chromosome segregation ATPase
MVRFSFSTIVTTRYAAKRCPWCRGISKTEIEIMPVLDDNRLEEQQLQTQIQTPQVDVNRLHIDLTLTNAQLRTQQVTLEHILQKLEKMDVSFHAFVTSKAVLDERLANEKSRMDSLQATVEKLKEQIKAVSEEHDRAKTQVKTIWWLIGTPVGLMLLALFKDHVPGTK